MHESLRTSLLDPSIQQFILEHENDDEQAIVLKYKNIGLLRASLVANQIKCRRKAKTKLPTLYKTAGIIYPPSQNLEQSSSEITARFKTELFKSGERFLDLTGGFGIDTFFFSKIFKEAHYVEPNQELLAIAEHNHRILNSQKIYYHAASAEDFLQNDNHSFDLIYLDPSRRTNGNQKVFRLSDCIPDAAPLLPEIFTKSTTALIKTSPLLDIQEGLKDLSFVEKVYVVSVQNDCKELLFLCKKNFTGEAIIETINFRDDQTERFDFTFSEEKEKKIEFSDPLTYLYEPNASILKAGAFRGIGTKFNLFKLNPSTHFYTSKTFVESFPGRIFKIVAFLKPDQKATAHYLQDGKANIVTRNYPLSTEQLKKRMKLKDGGQNYILGFSGMKSKYACLAERLK